MKKTIFSLLAIFMAAMATWADVVFNASNFPDANFRSYLQSLNYVTNGVITDATIARITYIGVNNKSIRSLKGIEYFTALQNLIYYDNEPSMTSVDLSKNTALTFLSIGGTLMTSLDLSKNTALKSLYCDSNQLISLDVSECTSLTTLSCYNNQLTSLDLSQNTVLERLDCYQNQIKDEAMDALVASLPVRNGRSGNILVIYDTDESNVMTTAQVVAAKAKGWMPRYYDGGSWQEYAGSEPTALEKCAMPTINYEGGKLSFSCETEGVEFVSEITCSDTKKNFDAEVTLSTTYNVSVYAKKKGYENSDVVTKEINVSGTSGLRGDANLDGKITMQDAMFIVNYILNGRFPDEEEEQEQAYLTCPDDNHPHMIDLGLPSGTKWACCNVGASKPEKYGNYYAWGETTTKSSYSFDNYAYYDKNINENVNIGSDIAGTEYDAATANWGELWQMPTQEQVQELINYTYSTWTTENGISGLRFTGDNDGTIFIPAAGYWEDSSRSDAGSCGCVWSSTLDEEGFLYLHCAYRLYFSSDYINKTSGNRYWGQNVRPVRK